VNRAEVAPFGNGGNVSQDIKVLKGALLIDGNGGDSIKNAVVVVEGKRITAAGSQASVSVPQGATVLDFSGYTLMPGLIDCHLHIAALNALTFSNYRAALFETSPQLVQFYALFHSQLCFERGFTTLRDMGRFTPQEGSFTAELVALRDGIAAGILAGPRLLVSGRATITCSHLDIVIPRPVPRPAGMTGDGPYELRRLAREDIRRGCDWLKTSATGGGGTSHEAPDIRNMTQDELEAIVDEAHAFDKYCAVHCFTAESHRRCVKAGVDTIEHIVFSDDDSVKAVADSGIPITPTLLHRTDYAIEIRRKVGTPKNTLVKMKQIQPVTFDSFKRFHQAGAKIAMGTDMGLDPYMGENSRELELYVELGMTPMEALLTATKNAADALHLSKEIGTIEAGKSADIIAVAGDPSRDVRVLQPRENIKLVMKEGRVYVDRTAPEPKTVLPCDYGTWSIIDQE
jgi:imidazolonepropionase-like amidohydrolase